MYNIASTGDKLITMREGCNNNSKCLQVTYGNLRYITNTKWKKTFVTADEYIFPALISVPFCGISG